MRKTVLAMIGLLLPLAALATGQEPDILIYDGQVFSLFSNPLEAFYSSQADRPDFRIDERGGTSTGNWRGYVAIWEIRDDTLYLVGLESWIAQRRKGANRLIEWIRGDNAQRADLKELFGERFQGGRVEAAWFSGELRIPDGKQLQYAHMGYGSVYERDIIFSIDRGRLTGKTVVDNTGKPVPSRLELEGRELEKLKERPPER